MDRSKGFSSPTIAEITAAAPVERQLALLLKAESLFGAAIAENGEDTSALFLCVLLQEAGNNYDCLAEPNLMLRMIRASCTDEENQRYIAAPFGLFAKGELADRGREMNLHRAVWLDFMILVLADEAGVELVESESENG